MSDDHERCVHCASPLCADCGGCWCEGNRCHLLEGYQGLSEIMPGALDEIERIAAPPRVSGCWGAPAVQDVLGVLLEALDIPSPATAGDQEAHDRILLERVLHTKIFLEGLAQDPDYVEDTIGFRIAYLRERLAGCPACGYRTWDEAVAELEARRTAGS